jgi:ABC-type transporter Mla subunit MlaD
LKLGLFAIFAVIAIAGVVLGLGIRLTGSDGTHYHTYFDESVQGLEIGAPVKYRGLTKGRVSEIAIAPDHRHVDVTMAVDERIAVPRELRAQLNSQGITGVKFVNLDLFDPTTNPVEPLPFPVAADTIPAATSLLGGLEQGLARAVDRLPAILDAMQATLGQIQHVFETFDREHLPENVARTVANTNLAVGDLRAVLHQLAAAQIPSRAARAVDDADVAMVKLAGVLDDFGGDAGVLASTRRAVDSFDAVGRRVSVGAEDLDRTLHDIREAARAIRDLADAIDHDPDMLLKGRAPRRAR